MNKIKILFFINENQKESQIITKYVRENVSDLKHFCILKFVKVNHSNENTIYQSGINIIPSIKVKDKIIPTRKRIIDFLLNLKLKTQTKVFSIPETFSMEDYARKEIENARKEETIVDGKKIKKFVFSDSDNDSAKETELYLKQISELRKGNTDFNRSKEEKFAKIGKKNENVKFSAEGNEEIDDQFMGNTDYYNSLAANDVDAINEELERYLIDESKKTY